MTATASATASATAPAVLAFEQRQRDTALAATRQRRLAEAALAWEILSVLRPDNADYRERHAQTLRQIDAAVAERLPRAARAAQRGDWDSATQLYLGVLALQPVNEVAAEALRGLERERIKRQQLGKSARQALALARSSVAPIPLEPPPTPAESNALEHAALLADDDEFEAAIALLERQLALDPTDVAVQRRLAGVQQRRADALVRQLKLAPVAPAQRATAASAPAQRATAVSPPAQRASAASAPAQNEFSPRR